MEYLTMFITHIFKTIQYFAVEGFPEIPLSQLPEAAEAFFWQSAKVIEIYLSII